MTHPNIEIEREDVGEGVVCLRIARPQKKNALTLSMYRSLTTYLQEAAADPDVRVVILTGTAGSFTSGNDVLDFMQDPPTSTDSPVFQFLLTFIDFPKPILAAVNGLAIGIGTTLLLHCDIVFAATNARFRLPFVSLGLVPEAASSLLLPQMIGIHHASELLMSGRFFDAEEAREIGFVRRLVAPESLWDRTVEMARQLAAQPPQAIVLTKALLRAPLREQIHEVLQKEGALFIERLQSSEAQEAFMRFLSPK